MRNKMMWLTVLFMALSLVSCDKLEDSDVTQDILPGRWTFGYETDEPLDYELSYKLVIFNVDGTCALTFADGQLEGTYRASRDVIRIDASVGNGEVHTLLWRVLTMSPYRVVAEYEHQINDENRVKMTVTLDKL